MDITPENADKLVETLAQFPTVVDRVVRAAVKPQSASNYESFTIRLPVNGKPIPVLGMDLSRSRAVLYSSIGPTVDVNGVVSGVRIGHLSDLGAGEGYALPNSSAITELRNTEEFYAVYTSTVGSPDPLAIVSVWVEKWSS
jgi:hypothetical protein